MTRSHKHNLPSHQAGLGFVWSGKCISKDISKVYLKKRKHRILSHLGIEWQHCVEGPASGLGCVNNWRFSSRASLKKQCFFNNKIGSQQSKISCLLYCGFSAVDKETLSSSSSQGKLSIWCESHPKQKQREEDLLSHSDYCTPLRSGISVFSFFLCLRIGRPLFPITPWGHSEAKVGGFTCWLHFESTNIQWMSLGNCSTALGEVWCSPPLESVLRSADRKERFCVM